MRTLSWALTTFFFKVPFGGPSNRAEKGDGRCETAAASRSASTCVAPSRERLRGSPRLRELTSGGRRDQPLARI
jgi:hypothetical protein